MRFGQEIISDFQRLRQKDGRVWAEGYTQDELDIAQERFGIVFPPDLIELFLDRRPVLGWDWRSDEQQIREMLERPFEGLLFDVENCGLWWPEWGDRPDHPHERSLVLRNILKRAPELAPLVSHRYIPCEPCEAGNPIFSINQSDVICYGANLAEFFENEFGKFQVSVKAPKYILFWSDLVDRAYRSPYYPFKDGR